MKKSAFPAALLLLGICLSGCPVYDDNASGCFDDYDCQYGYVCDSNSGACVSSSNTPPACHSPSDCPDETCSRSGTCTVGDCHFASIGCVRGYECSLVSEVWLCEPTGSGEGGSDSGAGGNGNVTSSGGEPNSTSGGAPSNGGEPNSTSGGASAANSSGAGG